MAHLNIISYGSLLLKNIVRIGVSTFILINDCRAVRGYPFQLSFLTVFNFRLFYNSLELHVKRFVSGTSLPH